MNPSQKKIATPEIERSDTKRRRNQVGTGINRRDFLKELSVFALLAPGGFG